MILKDTYVKNSIKNFIDITLKRLASIILVAIVVFQFITSLANREESFFVHWDRWIYLSILINCIGGIMNPERIQKITWFYLILFSALIFIFGNIIR